MVNILISFDLKDLFNGTTVTVYTGCLDKTGNNNNNTSQNVKYNKQKPNRRKIHFN